MDDRRAERRGDQRTRERLSEIQAGYERWARITFRALVVIGVTLVATAFALGSLNHRNGQARNALCTLRADLAQRATQAETYLRDHPNGFPGVSVQTLRTSVENQRRTVEALASLDC